MKYLVAKQWIAAIIDKSMRDGDPIFKDKEFKDSITKVMNDFHQLKYKEPSSS